MQVMDILISPRKHGKNFPADLVKISKRHFFYASKPKLKIGELNIELEPEFRSRN